MKEHKTKQSGNYAALISNRTPVLLQQGFPPIAVQGGITNPSAEYRARTDRGYLKYFDVVPGTIDTPELNQDVTFTLAAGGQNLVEDSQLGMWSPLAQFGKDKRWRIRAAINDAQTIQFSMNGENAVLEQQALLIASYSTKQHEAFLDAFKLKFGLGLKRKDYVLKFPAGTVAPSTQSIEGILPRNNGEIIAVGISNAYDIVGNNFLSNQFQSLAIDGVKIIEDVPASYYNIAVGRETWIQPVLLRAGSTFTFSSDSFATTGDDVYYTLTVFFDN